VFCLAKVVGQVWDKIPDHGISLTLANGSMIPLDRVFIIDFHITGRDVLIPVVVCRDLTSEAIISINLIYQEQLVFDAMTK
jgi:hypothetical protein